jgi:Ca2+-binding EF-hand superfamily protein
MDLEYSVTESITRNYGIINKIQYQFEEFSFENTSNGITIKKERRSRIYDTIITREHYHFLARRIRNALSFHNFLRVLRPFVMGYYQNDELEQAFYVLDRNHSGSIHVNELASFVPIINENATTDLLKNYIRKVDINADGILNYDEFRTLILKGIGRDIICNHL